MEARSPVIGAASPCRNLIWTSWWTTDCRREHVCQATLDRASPCSLM